MVYYSDSSSESETGLEDAITNVVEEGDVSKATWYAERNSDDLDSPPAEEQLQAPLKMTARAYQLEMLEASLKENIICAMDTGSGKTQV